MVMDGNAYIALSIHMLITLLLLLVYLVWYVQLGILQDVEVQMEVGVILVVLDFISHSVGKAHV
jgi:hypothetical protein